MSLINFPSSPSLNQTYTVGSKTWIWNGYAWDLQLSSGGGSGSSASSNAAFAQANAAFVQANTADTIAINAGSYANAAFAKANSITGGSSFPYLDMGNVSDVPLAVAGTFDCGAFA